MNWYQEQLQKETITPESSLEVEWKALNRRIHIFQKRYEMAKNDPKNSKDSIDNLYWEIEEMKGNKRKIEEKLRKNKRNIP